MKYILHFCIILYVTFYHTVAKIWKRPPGMFFRAESSNWVMFSSAWYKSYKIMSHDGANETAQTKTNGSNLLLYLKQKICAFHIRHLVKDELLNPLIWGFSRFTCAVVCVGQFPCSTPTTSWTYSSSSWTCWSTYCGKSWVTLRRQAWFYMHECCWENTLSFGACEWNQCI